MGGAAEVSCFVQPREEIEEMPMQSMSSSQEKKGRCWSFLCGDINQNWGNRKRGSDWMLGKKFFTKTVVRGWHRLSREVIKSQNHRSHGIKTWVQEEFGYGFQMNSLCSPVLSHELELMILVYLFQLWIFYNSMKSRKLKHKTYLPIFKTIVIKKSCLAFFPLREFWWWLPQGQ